MKAFEKFAQNNNLKFSNLLTLEQAFVHRSYLNEHKDLGIGHNERLEFLGDAVLELIVTDFLYKTYPEKNEGELTSYRASLVNANTLATVAEKLGVNEALLLSKGEARDKGRARNYILADTMEAIIGAIYVDQGYDIARDFIIAHVTPLLPEILSTQSFLDSKSRFQEVAQEKVGITPAYRLIKQDGPDHDKRFTVGVFLGEELMGQGEGLSKQDAEQGAAREALEKKGWS